LRTQHGFHEHTLIFDRQLSESFLPDLQAVYNRGACWSDLVPHSARFASARNWQLPVSQGANMFERGLLLEAIWRQSPLDILVNDAAATFIAQSERLSFRAADAILVSGL
jgi:hypothetical protein